MKNYGYGRIGGSITRILCELEKRLEADRKVICYVEEKRGMPH